MVCVCRQILALSVADSTHESVNVTAHVNTVPVLVQGKL
jgi:hypothetical protein